MFANHCGIARPGDEAASDLQWFKYYKGHRIYNQPGVNRWVWNYQFKVTPGEIFFDAQEHEFARKAGWGYVFVEPNLPWHKGVAVNKDWGEKNYQAVTDQLLAAGADVVQTSYGPRRLKGVRTIETPTFRHAMAVLSRARMAILPEGGMHHAAAALGIPAVVMFGGFIPPQVLGYDGHINLTGGASEACGSMSRCQHCADALARISVDEVFGHAKGLL